jgi:hypothetical protein
MRGPPQPNGSCPWNPPLLTYPAWGGVRQHILILLYSYALGPHNNNILKRED